MLVTLIVFLLQTYDQFAKESRFYCDDVFEHNLDGEVPNSRPILHIKNANRPSPPTARESR